MCLLGVKQEILLLLTTEQKLAAKVDDFFTTFRQVLDKFCESLQSGMFWINKINPQSFSFGTCHNRRQGRQVLPFSRRRISALTKNEYLHLIFSTFMSYYNRFKTIKCPRCSPWSLYIENSAEGLEQEAEN